MSDDGDGPPQDHEKYGGQTVNKTRVISKSQASKQAKRDFLSLFVAQQP